MSEHHEARRAIAELLHDFANKEASPCTEWALGNLAMVAFLGDDPSISKARRRAGERRNSALERAFETAGVA